MQMPFNKGKKRIHRLVVLPEFQGLSIGVNFLNAVTEIYCKLNWNVHITTSNRALVHSLEKNPYWVRARRTELNRNGSSATRRVDATWYRRFISSFKSTTEMWEV